MLDPYLVDSLVRIIVAAVLGAAIGLERELHGQPAGLRTHILVCLASTLLIVISRPGALAAGQTLCVWVRWKRRTGSMFRIFRSLTRIPAGFNTSWKCADHPARSNQET